MALCRQPFHNNQVIHYQNRIELIPIRSIKLLSASFYLHIAFRTLHTFYIDPIG